MRNALFIFGSLFGFASTSYAYDYEYPRPVCYNIPQCSHHIQDLEEEVHQLKERIRALEDSVNAAIRPVSPPWVCTVHGFNKDYSEVGPTKLIASMEASKKCRKHDKNDGFFCGEPSCAQ